MCFPFPFHFTDPFFLSSSTWSRRGVAKFVVQARFVPTPEFAFTPPAVRRHLSQPSRLATSAACHAVSLAAVQESR
jgi:hypothetical protein